MSFSTMKIAELKQIAEDFAVDLPNSKSKAEIIAAFAEEGVTWDIYQKTLKKKSTQKKLKQNQKEKEV